LAQKFSLTNLFSGWLYFGYTLGSGHMLAKIQQWENSQGLRLAKNLLADAQLEVGDEVDISVKDGIMIVTPAKRIRGKYSLKALVAGIPENYQTGEADWRKPILEDSYLLFLQFAIT
jgi:antitoxin MazE